MISILVLCLCASLVSTALPAAIPADWQSRIDASQMLFSATELPDVNLMPAVANGFVGYVVGSDSMYASGVYAYSKETAYGYIDPSYEGAKRARIPSTLSISLNTSASPLSLVGIAVDFERATVYKRFNSSLAHVEQAWFAHRTNRSLLVHTITVTNRDSAAPLQIHLVPLDVAPSKDIAFRDVSRSPLTAIELTGKLVKAETPDSPLVQVSLVSSPIPSSVTTPPASTSVFTFVTCVRTSLESNNTVEDAYSDFLAANASSIDVLVQTHQQAWLDLWDSFGIDLSSAPVDLSSHINSTLYNLLGQMREDFPFPINTGGLATNGYDGMYWWDTDFWIMPSLIHFQPELVRVALEYRFQRLPQAMAHAAKHGFKGAYFPWQTAYSGVDVSFVPPANVLEQHIAADVVLLVKQYWDLTNDTDWLRSRGWPMAFSVAEFWASRMVKNADNTYSIHNVVGPDEFAIGEISITHFPYTGVSNNAFTNAAVKTVIEFARNVSLILGESFPADWLGMASNLTILFDSQHKRHPEYFDFPYGNLFNKFKVKQADVTLLAYPLAFPMSDEVKQNDLEYYESMYFADGPGMTNSISSIVWMDLGNVSNAYDRFNKAHANLQPPFDIWTETVDPAKHEFDMGCYMFMTAAGGYMQNIVNGFFGLRLAAGALTIRPTMLPDTSAMRIRGVFYRGWRVDVHVFSNHTVNLLPTASVGSTALFAQVDGAPQRVQLSVGQGVAFELGGAATLRLSPLP